MSKRDPLNLYAAMERLRKKGEAAPVAPAYIDFYALVEELKERYARLDKYSIELINLQRELTKMQSQIRECYERAEQEIKTTAEKHERLILRLLQLLDDIKQRSAEKDEVPCRPFLKYVRAELQEAVRREGIKAIRVRRGKLFDPRIHTPSRRILDKELQEGTIVDVIAPGYVEGSRILRKAEVVISYREGA